ncbi:cytochrome B5-like protein CB5LP [Acrasis kona]|uniref:Cytochrome B5-like protein CB5LP n=1 Tax=Acrasis kona TaxID=1008807 RepID=A0AAW2ZEH0_9EUKA
MSWFTNGFWKDIVIQEMLSPVALGLLIGVIGVIIYYFVSRRTEDDSEREIQEQEEAEKLLMEKGERIITRKEVAEHCDMDDLWVIVDNKVYDLTMFVNKHPGGDVITRNAGGDATKGFYGIQHPERAFVEIEDYIIGKLPENERSIMFQSKDLDGKHYVVIKGRVHDVTSFLDEHPGGTDNLTMFAGGKDATSAFYKQHPKHAVQRLPEFFVGYLMKEGEPDFISNNVKKRAVEAQKRL